MKHLLLIILCTLTFPFSIFAEEDARIDLPNAIGDFAEPINASRSSINAFSCAEIASGWKDNETVSKYLKIGHTHGTKFLSWMEKAPQEKMLKVAMNMAGFWNINSPGKSISPDFYLGRVSASVSSFLYDKYLKEIRPKSPPKDTVEYLKNEQNRILAKREKLFIDYQCLKLK
ncbi:MAG: hypothetical protein AAGB31_05840 [Bdellovibrio sp.]